MGLAARVKIHVRAAITSGEVLTAVDQVVGNGVTINNADKVAKWTTSTATNTDVDIMAQLDPAGQAANFAEVVAVLLETPTANPGDIRIKPASSNGWTGLQSGTTDYLTLKPGTTLLVFCPLAAAYAMSGSSKSINVASSTGTSQVTITVIGRSA